MPDKKNLRYIRLFIFPVIVTLTLLMLYLCIPKKIKSNLTGAPVVKKDPKFKEVKVDKKEPIKPSVKSENFIYNWNIIGLFDNTDKSGFAKAYPVEKEINFKKSYDAVEEKAKWKAYTQDSPDYLSDNQIDFNKIFGYHDWVCAYAYATFNSKNDKNAYLFMGSDDTITVWLNGEMVHENEVYRGLNIDEDSVEVKIKKGKNEILVKVCQGEADFRFILRIADEKGKPIKGLSY